MSQPENESLREALAFLADLSNATTYRSHDLGYEDSISIHWREDAADLHKKLASRASATSEYERGRRDGLEQAAQHHRVYIENPDYPEKDNILQGWGQCICGEAKADGVRYYSVIWTEHIRALAATSSTPAEHDPARAPHDKFASLWCDACPRPASSTTNVREAFEKWYAVYKDITLYIDGMQDAFEAGYNARSKERDAQAAELRALAGSSGPPSGT